MAPSTARETASTTSVRWRATATGLMKLAPSTARETAKATVLSKAHVKVAKTWASETATHLALSTASSMASCLVLCLVLSRERATEPSMVTARGARWLAHATATWTAP